MISRSALWGLFAGIAIGAVAAGGSLWLSGLFGKAPAEMSVEAEKEAVLADVQARVDLANQSCTDALAYLQKSVQARIPKTDAREEVRATWRGLLDECADQFDPATAASLRQQIER